MKYIGARWAIVLWLGVLCAMTSSCGSDDDKKEFGGSCEGDGDCVDGLFCPKGGELRGICTMACSVGMTAICGSKFGDSAYCHVDSVCALSCNPESPCPAPSLCDTEGSPDTCKR